MHENLVRFIGGTQSRFEIMTCYALRSVKKHGNSLEAEIFPSKIIVAIFYSTPTPTIQ